MAPVCASLTMSSAARVAMAPSRVTSARRSSARAPLSKRVVVVRAADNDKTGTDISGGRTGYIGEDNSGKANIFAVEPKKVYLSSPTRDAEAKEGLGGVQGLGIVGLALLGVGAGLVAAKGGAPPVVVPEAFDADTLKTLSYYLANL